MRKISLINLVAFRKMVLLVELAVFEESVYFGSNIGIHFNVDSLPHWNYVLKIVSVFNRTCEDVHFFMLSSREFHLEKISLKEV